MIFGKIDPYNFELYRFKVGAFFETQCRWFICMAASGWIATQTIIHTITQEAQV